MEYRNRLRCLWMLLSLMIWAGSAAAEEITIGYFDLPPHAMIEDGKHTGALIDYWETYVAPAMGVTLNWRGPLPPVRLLNELETGRLNVIALMAKNDERQKLFDFPEKPFFKMNSGLAVLRENPLSEIKSVEDLVHLKIGFFQKGIIPPAMQDSRITWEMLSTADWQTSNVQKLMAGRIDAVFNAESYSLSYVVHTMAYEDKIKVMIIPGTEVGNFSLFSKKDNGRFLKLYMDAQKEVDRKVLYKDILQKYLDLKH